MAHASLRQAQQPHYSPATSADLALLDMLTSEATPGQAAASQQHHHVAVKRPLATLAALRRPPIDPIILAASLSTGPHVTRHHFHHSYGAPRAATSKQMPVAERKARREAAAAAAATQQQHHHRNARSHSIGGYASCNLTDDALAGSSSSSAAAAAAALQAPLEQVDILAGIIDDVPAVTDEERALYASRQAPRSVRLKAEAEQATRRRAAAQVNERPAAASEAQALQSSTAAKQQLSEALHSRQALLSPAPLSLGDLPHAAPHLLTPAQGGQATPISSLAGLSSIVRPPPLQVRCYARTRIPTPHGEVFCHLYRNNHDAKEHLALVVDPAQNSDATQRALLQGGDGSADGVGAKKHLRSTTLDEVWSPHETEMERIVRGAYVGRLGPGFQQASDARRLARQAHHDEHAEEEAPLVRIHSECYTGETIGSQRCDCGEQLDEAIRLIHAAASSEAGGEARGVVVYLRQEGRGIGLLDKLMAYNLQDMGHDTVSANVLLGHLPDARKYDVAAAILRDLGVGSCKLLTNNPDKMEALEREGVRVTQRVAMVPRAWREELGAASRRRKAARRKASRARTASGGSVVSRRKKRAQAMDASILSQAPSPRADSPRAEGGFAHAQQHRQQSDSGGEEAASADDDAEYYSESDEAEAEAEYVDHVLRRSGATMLGASVTRGVELEKYLRTKVERMGHMLDLPPVQAETSGASTPAVHAASASHAHPLSRSYSASQVQALPLTPGTDGGHQLGGTADGNGTDPDSLLGEAELGDLNASNDTDVRSQPDEETVLIARRTSAV